jgi:hypothetical protein
MGLFPQARQLVLPYQSEQLRTTPWGLVRTLNGHPVYWHRYMTVSHRVLTTQQSTNSRLMNRFD